MIEDWSNRITDFFIDRAVIDEDDRDIYLYGAELLVSEVLCTIITLGIGFFLGRFMKTIFYLLIYTLVRVYAGGYHAMSHKMCITIFNVLYVLFVIVTELLFHFNISYILCFSTIIAIMIIVKLSPVEDLRKPLEKYEIERYRLRAIRRAVLCGVTVISLYIFFPFAKDEMGYGMIAICEVALLLIIGYIKNQVCYLKTHM